MHILDIGSNILVGLTGLLSDARTILDKLKKEKDLYELQNQRPITPKVVQAF